MKGEERWDKGRAGSEKFYSEVILVTLVHISLTTVSHMFIMDFNKVDLFNLIVSRGNPETFPLLSSGELPFIQNPLR